MIVGENKMHVTIWVAIITSIVSPTLLFIFQLIRDKREGVVKKLDELSMRQLRIELLALLYHEPMNTVAILQVWDEYKHRGGNSYMKELIRDWKKKHKIAADI